MSLPATAFPRLLAGFGRSGPLDLADHDAGYGVSGGVEARRSAPALVAELERAGLRGMGGGSFPTATKLAAVAAQRGRPLVVVNGAEGEPLSQKDRVLLDSLPHLVLDGAIAVAQALGSREIVLARKERPGQTTRLLATAIADRPDLGRRRRCDLVEVPTGYVTGQETALVSFLGGGAPKPTVAPPYPYERGVGGRPTFVANVETFAQVGLIARHGADWYRAIGTDSAPGSRLITVCGAVAEPSTVEAAGGTDVTTLLNAAGGTFGAPRAMLLGGYAGTWVLPEEVSSITVDEAALRERGLTLGSGIAFVLAEDACPVSETAAVARYLSRESADQCGPCMNGLRAIAEALTELCADGDRTGAFRRVERWCRMVVGRGACAHPDGTARFVTSALRCFGGEFEDHAAHGRCEHCGPAELLVGADRVADTEFACV